MRRLIFTLVVFLVAAPVSRAEEVTYTLNQAQSFLNVGGVLTNNFANPQATGSTTTNYIGTIKADRVGNTIKFIDGSVIDALVKGNYQPNANAQPGTSAAADYGRQAVNNLFSTTMESLRDVTLDLASNDFITITSGSFPSDSFRVIMDSGESDFAYGGSGFGEVDLSGKFAVNVSSTASTIQTVGSDEVLTLHISSDPIGYNVINSGDSTLTFTGTIVATRLVPEPSALLLAVLACPLMRRPRN